MSAQLTSLDKLRLQWEEDWLSFQDRLSIDTLPSHPLPGKPAELVDVKHFVAFFQSAFPDLEFGIEELISSEDRMVIRWEMHGTHTCTLMGIPPTGMSAKLTGISIYRLEDGRPIECWDQVDLLSLFHQLALI